MDTDCYSCGTGDDHYYPFDEEIMNTPCPNAPDKVHCFHPNAQNVPGFQTNTEFLTCCYCNLPWVKYHGSYLPYIPQAAK